MGTSRTDAHRVFATLYRKKRSAEHQKKVDEIITRSNDVFIRIDLIKKLDEEFLRNEREKQQEEPIKENSGHSKALVTSSKPKVPATTSGKRPVKVKEESSGGGFFNILFGTNNAISKFAKDSRSLEMGLFGRKPVISKSVERLFRSLREEQIISAIQVLKYAEAVGWKIWTPYVYNVIANFSRFFNSFISLDSLFRDEISPEVFLGRSTKMQLYYVRHLGLEGVGDLIMKNITEIVKQDEKLAPKLQTALEGIAYALNLEKHRPTLTDALCAFHIVKTRRMVAWEEIEKELKVAPIDEHKYAASQDIQKQIEVTTSKIFNDIREKENRLEDIKELRNTFFKVTDKGKLSFDFLNPIIDDYITHYYPETMQTPGLKSTFKTNPHRLLQLVGRDLQSIYFSILEGYVKINDGQVKDVLLVQNGLLFAELDKINYLIRSLDTFNRKFTSFQYTFEAFAKDAIKGSQDQVEAQILSVLSEAAEVFSKLGKKLHIVLDNHAIALRNEEKGALNDNVIKTKEKTIEDLKISQRFIPYADARVVMQNRIDGKSIYDIFFEMT
ncbi:MAG: hypothetical protein AAF518_06405, partial [Spirochaetota bacterium]